MKPNKAPGPDGFPVEFYRKCWHIIKDELMPMFHYFFNEHIELFHLNFGMIRLLAKKEEAVCIKQFMPICLLNVSLKIITKVVMNRLTRCVSPVISPTQTSFIRGRYIMEG